MLLLGLVSQDKALCEAILEQIKQAEGWQSAVFESPQAALDIWQTSFPPLVVWDSGACSPESATHFLNCLRNAENKPWLVVIGGLPVDNKEMENIDFLAKPLRLGKLLSRLHFYKRRLQQPPDVVFRLGPFVFYPRRRVLSAQGTETRLTDKETALLEYLASAKEPSSKDELLEEIWGYGSQIDTHTLETHIYLLRQKLMAHDPEGKDCFSVERGRYWINAAWAQT